ncbi:hypothetical protein [Pendulispora albinea]|uniref:DUF1552 domain-containing protein n=1 Tax=Pendulispora albinea TaxID=2741071 RepID=A0ABZ2M6G4_9BACT
MRGSIDPAGRVLHARCQEWYAKQLATLLSKLGEKDPLDPAHTILENSVVLWCSEIADGQAHNCQSLPLVMMGGGGGYLKGKQIVNLGARSHAGLLLSLCESMGVNGIDVGNGGAAGALREVKA